MSERELKFDSEWGLQTGGTPATTPTREPAPTPVGAGIVLEQTRR
jgi:hypothetical protein